MTVAVVVGNPKPRSRTYQAAHIVAERLTGRTADLSVDLTEHGAALGATCPTAGLFLLESEFARSDELAGWLERARPQVTATTKSLA